MRFSTVVVMLGLIFPYRSTSGMVVNLRSFSSRVRRGARSHISGTRIGLEPIREAKTINRGVSVRGGGSGAVVDLLVSVLVLIAVSAAAHSGSSFLAAALSTAPTGVPLSLWLVHRAAQASDVSSAAARVEQFLLACIQGTVALASFCLGALFLVRHSPGVGEAAPSLAALLFVGYASWAMAWALLRHLQN